MKLPDHVADPNPQRYLSERYTTVDYETTNRNKGSAIDRTNRIVLATWLENGRLLEARRERVHNGISYAFGDEYHQEELADSVKRTRYIVAHNAKFELQWLARSGIEVSTLLVWDTMLAEFVLAGNRRFDLSLEGTALRNGLGGKKSLVSKLIAGGICPGDIPQEWLLEYGVEDTSLCHQIFLKQRERLAAEGLLPVMYTRCLLTPVLAEMEMHGVQLDADEVKKAYERSYTDYLENERKLSEFAKINWNSPSQVGDFIYDTLGFPEFRRGKEVRRTATGKRLTDADTLSNLRAFTPDQRHFLEIFKEFKKLEKKQSTLEKLLKCVKEDDGRLYAQYNQAVAGTHRLTSSGLRHKVQFQNIDITLKKLFKARDKDSQIGEADGVQLEFRVAAHLGRDPVALADIRNPKFDVHWQTAEEIYQQSRTELSKEHHRYHSKPTTFRPLYGATSGSLAERRYIKFFQQKYKAIYDTQTAWTYEVLREKRLRTETGLIFYWPDTKLEPTPDGRGYIRNRTAIFNYPVQSLATADIIPIALVYFWHRIKALGLKMILVNTVHDSIIAEVPNGECEQFIELSKRCFTVDCFNYLNRVYSIDFVSPLGVEAKVGSHWSLGKETKYDLDPQAAD